MNLKKRILSFTAAGALAAGVLATFGTGAAQAAPSLGTLTLTPATGNESTGLNASLSAACPAGSTGIVGYMSGPGISAGNDVLQGNRAPAQSFAVSSIFKDVFAANSIAAPSGAFTVRMACIGADFFTEVGEFSQVVNFTPRGGTNNANYATVVPAADTTTTLSQNNASGAFGDSVTFTADADVVGGGETGGTIQFKDGATNLGAAQTVNASGVASFTTTTLAVGTHPITAVFTPANTVTHNASTSNGVSHVVNAIATGVTLSSNSPSAQYAPATFTATVSPVVAGTVTFKEGAATLGTASVNGSGVATYSNANLSVGTHSITAHFEPDAGTGADASDSNTVAHVVDAFSGVSLTENVTVTIDPGTLVIVLDPAVQADGNAGDGNVHLGTAIMDPAGDKLTASGQMDRVKVTDTRAGDPGWVASGIVTNFIKGADQINGYNLGWEPQVFSSSANQVGITDGADVVAGTEGLPGTTPSDAAVGLKASRTLATALDNAGNGTAVLGALLRLNIPTDVPGGTYAALLTITVS